MGIEAWALLVLVAVLAVYLLPVLIGRRELLGHARAGDRYSGRLRILATTESPLETEACPQGGHAELFRRPPEVRAMKRPAVRNVRALRAERELVRARQAHAHARAARQKAASHRLVVACALLGVLLGTGLVAALSPFPWWPVLVPTAPLALSMAAGRHAAVVSAQAEQRERARIAELEAEVVRLTGRALPESAAEGGVPGEAGVAREAREMSRAGEERAVAREAELGLERGAAAETGEAVEAASVVETVVPEAAPAEASPVAAAVAESSAVSAEAASVKAEPAKAAPVAGASTPPQGWEPVSVPAPTYTLVGTARRRRLEDLSDLASSAPAQVSVPARPVAARPVAPVAVVTPQAPIDLDAVLERRRASGE